MGEAIGALFRLYMGGIVGLIPPKRVKRRRAESRLKAESTARKRVQECISKDEFEEVIDSGIKDQKLSFL